MRVCGSFFARSNWAMRLSTVTTLSAGCRAFVCAPAHIVSEKTIKDALQRYLACPDKDTRLLLWAEFVKAHAARSVATVNRMERERGLV
mgnify:CR=1 FL=1